MSSALVRQALEFVDQEECGVDGDRRAARRAQKQRAGQDYKHLYKQKNKRASKEVKSKEEITEENVKKLLALSKATANSTISEKIVERAIKGKPLADKIEVKTEKEKSILFPDEEPFKKFEKEYFCS